MVRKNNEIQIKDEKQLEDLTNSVKFMSSKFDECEKERLKREARIVELESKVVSMSTKVEKLEYTADKMEQYSKLGIPMSKKACIKPWEQNLF